MPDRKIDAQRIETFINELKEKSWIKHTSRSFWPSYLFHYTPIDTAVKILSDEKLICRYDLENSDELVQDIASRDIIDQTKSYVKRCVRLYFRPLTPTQYHVEGVRPQNKISPFLAHCPIPIFFLFDSIDLLTRENTKYSDGNLSREYAQLGSSAEFLENLPFSKIYHVGPYNINLNREIKFHRCAEIIIEKEFDLSALKFICCRSEAEKDYFLYLLPLNLWEKWQNKVVISRIQLYENKWTFLEKVNLFSKRIVMIFSPDTITPGPFKAVAKISNLETGAHVIKGRDNFFSNSSKVLFTKVPDEYKNYKVEISLDANRIYANSFYINDF